MPTETPLTPLGKAEQALAHHDQFNRFGDDQPLFMCPENYALYELPHKEGQFTLADLRDLVAFAKDRTNG